MRNYKYIPFDELRKQYKREKRTKEDLLFSLALMAFELPIVAWLLF